MNPESEPLGRVRELVSVERAIDLFVAALHRDRRPANTVASYRYDLLLLARSVAVKDVGEILPSDIAAFLADANASTTRKRRLTSLRAFYRFLIEDARIVSVNPVEGFLPHRISPSIPIALSSEEERALLEAARVDEPWSELAIMFMISGGLSRRELLILAPADVTEIEGGIEISIERDVTVDAPRRTVTLGPAALESWQRYRQAISSRALLFPVGPQAINGMVERVRRRARIERRVTPRTLRDTFTVDLARLGASVDEIIASLGLANEYRNRQMLQRICNVYGRPDQAESEDRSSS